MSLLNNKVAIITGSSRGIGRAIAVKYSENGAKVVLNHTKSGKDIDETVAILTSRGADFNGCSCRFCLNSLNKFILCKISSHYYLIFIVFIA